MQKDGISHQPSVVPDGILYVDGVMLLDGIKDKCMKSSGCGMSSMPGVRGTVILRIYPADDGGGAELQGET